MERGGTQRTRAITVHRRLRSELSNLNELKSLAEAAGYEVLDSIEQVRKPSPRYHVGGGKAKELADIVSKLKVEKIIFGNELKPVQNYNLAKVTNVEVIDRFQLILEIFVRRASTREAKLQIDLARLQYELAHAKEKVRLAKKGEQPGFHGLGKYEVDVYYDTIQRQVNSIQDKLGEIRRTRDLHRTRRRKLGFPSVSLAGYTASGKSTLFNALTDENVAVGSSLFTTLSTTTRKVDLFGREILLTDTVGFIENLPLMLMEAFRSTLEETIFSDLILLVVDVSEPEQLVRRKVSSCLDTIQKIGAGRIPIATVLNKTDLTSEEDIKRKTESLNDLFQKAVPVSALHRTNLDLLKEEMVKYFESNAKSSFALPTNDESMSLLSWVLNSTSIHHVEYEGSAFKVTFESSPQFADEVRNRVKKLGGIFRNA